jgi:NAD(P)H-dependent flavin oxidoreductase YrpB (nitropropane dioxygenase family)
LELPGYLADLIGRIRSRDRRVLVVVSSLAAARAADAAGADGLIAKGHEAGGWVGEETAFVLVQRLRQHVGLPVWVQGGIGRHTVAACYVAGAAGAVLDNQLLLTRESPLLDDARSRVAAMDGSETISLGAVFGAAFRAYARPDLPTVRELRRLETSLRVSDQTADEKRRNWRAALRERVGWHQPEASVLAFGQDTAMAARLAERFGTVGGAIAGLRQAIEAHCAAAQKAKPLAEGAPLAVSHGTRYPIVQGPMTRVSDRAEFAAAVAEAGALPFCARRAIRWATGLGESAFSGSCHRTSGKSS